MKTTLELPESLLRRTKAEAAHQGRSMKDVVVEALEEKLRKKASAVPGWRVAFGRASRAGEGQVAGRSGQRQSARSGHADRSVHQQRLAVGQRRGRTADRHGLAGSQIFAVIAAEDGIVEGDIVARDRAR